MQVRRAIELDSNADALVTARRRELLGAATAFSGDMDEAAVAYRAAADAYAEHLDVADAARDGVARAVSALGDVLIEQLQFGEAEELADHALRRIGAADDLATARLLYTRAWARIAYQSNADVVGDLTRVSRIAERVGEPSLQLDADFHRDTVRGELGQIGRDEMISGSVHVAELAEHAGNPRRAGAALRSAAVLSVETRPGQVAGFLDRSEELATAHGLREDQAWVAYARAETALATGDWAAAWEAADRAVAIGEANAYHRPVVRTWTVITAIALAQGRTDALERAKAWLDPKRASFPDSPFGRFMHGAMDVRFATAGLLPPFEPGADLLDIWSESPGVPSFYAAMETVLDEWIARHRFELVDAAVERMEAWPSEGIWATPYRTGSEALVRGRLALARGAPAMAVVEGRSALAAFASLPAPWGIVKAVRLLEAAGAASSDEIAGASDFEASLGINRVTS